MSCWEKEDNLGVKQNSCSATLKQKLQEIIPNIHTGKESNKYLRRLCEQFTAVTDHRVLENLRY